MSKKLTLDMEYTPEFRLIGVFTPLKDYRLCWLLNRQLKTDLRRLPDFTYYLKKQDVSEEFSADHYKSRETREDYFLLSNKGNHLTLLPKPKNMDYLLLLRQAETASDTTALVKSIRKIPAIQAAYILDSFPAGAKEVLYDFEMFLNEALKQPPAR